MKYKKFNLPYTHEKCLGDRVGKHFNRDPLSGSIVIQLTSVIDILSTQIKDYGWRFP